MRHSLILLGFCFLSQSFALDVNEIINKTLAKYENMNSFYAEFDQEYCDGSSGVCQLFKGKIYFLRPNFFRMEFTEPKQMYVGDSVSLWVYLPDEKRAIRQNFGQVPFAVNPDIFLKDYEEHFNATLVKETDNNFEIALTPIEETEIYEMITISIHNKKFEITAITITDGTGTKSNFDFHKIKINKNISKKLFKFQPPKGTKIDEY